MLLVVEKGKRLTTQSQVRHSKDIVHCSEPDCHGEDGIFVLNQTRLLSHNS